MNRIKLIKYILNKKQSKNYLEIGVFSGHTFFKIKSTFKIAVDPEFQFRFFRKLIKTVINPYNLFNKYFQKTSDRFFSEDVAGVLESEKIDVALIDGMHEYNFALRDVENSLKYLAEDGIIIMHDCNPVTEDTSSTFEEWQLKGMIGSWNGDLWKTIIHLRSLRNDINVFVLDCDHGLGIVTKRKPENALYFSAEEINALTYRQFNANRAQWLDLKDPDYIFDYIKRKT